MVVGGRVEKLYDWLLEDGPLMVHPNPGSQVCSAQHGGFGAAPRVESGGGEPGGGGGIANGRPLADVPVLSLKAPY